MKNPWVVAFRNCFSKRRRRFWVVPKSRLAWLRFWLLYPGCENRTPHAFRKTISPSNLPGILHHILILGLIVAVACSFSACSKKGGNQLKLITPSLQERTLESYQATAPNAMIAVPNKEAAEIGLAVLKRGGNATDAAIAVSLALSVLRPQSTGIGGGGFLLFYNHRTKKTTALDFRELAPWKATRDMYLRDGKADTDLSQEGGLAVAVPRLLAGLGYLYDHFASHKIPWAALVQPSIDLAERGFIVYPHLAESMESQKELLSHFPTAGEIFLQDGKPWKVGETLVQKDLAKTLTLLSREGWKSFFKGSIAGAIVKTVQKNGGILTQRDFESIEAAPLEPVEGTFRNYRVVSMPPPSSGGAILIEILNILEPFDLKGKGPMDPTTIHIATEAMKRAFLDRAQYLGDTRFVKVPLQEIVSKEYAKRKAKSIHLQEAIPSDKLSPVALHLRESDSTTHFSIVDEEGNAVASTQTINYTFGSGLVAEGTGIVLNNEMDDFSLQPGVPNVYGLVGNEANAIAPGKIPLSSMSPTLVFNPRGELEMVVGSPGGPRIITAVLHTILNQIEFGASPLEAVAAKRYHHQWLPDQLSLEAGLNNQELSQTLSSLGHSLKESSYAGLVMLVTKSSKGWSGVCDPRGDGVPLGY